MACPLILERRDGFFGIPLFEGFGLKARFTTRECDMAFGKKSAAAALGRREALKKIGISWRRLVAPSQVHGPGVVFVDERLRGRGAFSRKTAIPETDALITAAKNIPIAVLTADCLPVFIFDPRKEAVAIVHAGWKGLANKIISKTVKKMEEAFESDPADFLVAFGPAIRSCCYEVGEDFLKYFSQGFVRRNGRLFFDIPLSAASELKECGVLDSRIFDSFLCTSCMSEHFFSFRREGEHAGRGMSVAEIV